MNSSNGSSYINSIQPKSDALSLRAMRYSNSSSSVGVGITYSNQDKLPRLPIPTLNETFPKLLSRVQAVIDEKELEETKLAIDCFLKNEGPFLQQKLVEYGENGFNNKEIGSYVEEFWNESYLQPDVSSVLNLNPFFILEDSPDPKIGKDQLRRAASLCYASIKFASSLRNETLEPDYVKGTPLCMDQFKVLFGSSRQPVMRLDTNQDDVHVYNDSTHVVVMYKNQFYYFPVLWPEKAEVAVDEGDILEILRAIVTHTDTNTSQEDASKTALGGLTSLPRSEWAVARKELCQSSEANRLALKVIDSALFLLVLDDFAPENIHSAAANALHGCNHLIDSDTLQVGTCMNRWYDKLQIIVCKDGTSNVNFEHATIDGHTALRLVSDVFAETVISFAQSIVNLIHGHGRVPHVINAKVRRVVNCGDDAFDVLPKKILFDLPNKTMKRISYAESALCDSVVASDTYVLEFLDYGKKAIVANGMSPDAFVQMSILLAYYKLYGRVVCMYEPAMTKSFYHGRTEAIRGATIEAKRLCIVWESDDASRSDKLQALKVAVLEHSRLTREAASGKGVDRHLFALKCLASRLNLPTPKLFESPGWKAMNHTILSTSNCGNSSLRLFGFGPVVPDGFGVGYIIKDHGISYSVSSKHRQTRRFVGSLRKVLKEMEDLQANRMSIAVEQTQSNSTVATTSPFSTTNDSTPYERLESYGDVWGERSVSTKIAEEIAQESTSYSSIQSSKLFNSVSNKSVGSVDLNCLEYIKIDVDLQPNK